MKITIFKKAIKEAMDWQHTLTERQRTEIVLADAIQEKEDEILKKYYSTSDSKMGYAKKCAMSYYNKVNNNLPTHLKLNITGDAKYQIIEKIISEAVEQAIHIQETGKPLRVK